MTYSPGQSVNINPSAQPQQEGQQFSGEFAALVKIVSSRYVKIEYPAELGYSPKIGIKWVMLSTKGNEFDRTYSTGIGWDTTATVSTDGKRIIAQTEDFKGLKPSCDALFLLQKAIASGYPAEQLTDDISVFEGQCFFLTTDVNPRWKGSSKKPYPKQYHPEGWDAALAAKQAKDAAKATSTYQSNPNTTAQLTQVYTPPPVVVADQVMNEAATALAEILSNAGGKVTRTEIPAKLNAIAGTKSWTPKTRQDITMLLWNPPTLAQVVSNLPIAKIDGETITLV